MAQDKKAKPKDAEGQDEVSELRARVAELETQLAEAARGQALSPAARWAGWILGALVGATSLALIVVLLGGGLGVGQAECPEDQPSEDLAAEHRLQLTTERLVREHVDDINGCIGEFASSHASEMVPGWSVILRLDVQAGDGGRVERVEASGEDLPRELGACFEQRVSRWVFPAPGNYPIVLPFALDSQPQPPESATRRGADAGDGDAGT